MIRRFGKYEVEAEIGRGGFGRVYRAYDPSVGRQVAIKVITAEGDPSLGTRFRAEAMAAGGLHHKNIVTIHEFGEYEGEQFLVMEYLDGTDLQHFIDHKTPLSLLEKNDIMVQVAQGLQCAHEHGVVHRDVKPANIMRNTDGSVKIMDFGIARVLREAATRLTQAGYMVGTLRYMAPEQFRSADTDTLCDIWAYGVVYYELVTGIYPFNAPNPGTMMSRITRDEVEPIKDLVPECTPELDAVIGRLLAKNREERYQSLEDFLFDAIPVFGNIARAQLPALVEKAENLIQADQTEEAQSLIRRILELDPSNKQVRQWREDLRDRARRRSIRPRVDELVRQAEEYVEQRNYSAALEKIDSALRLDPVNTTLRSRLEQFRENAEKAKRADRLVVEAKRELHNLDLTGAFDHIQQALANDPKNSDASRLLDEVKSSIADREAKAKLKLKFSKAKGLIVMQAYDEAISILKALLEEAPRNPEISEQLAEATRLKQEQEGENRFNVAIGESKDLLKRGEYHGALEIVNALEQRFPSKNDVVRPIKAYALEQIQADRKAVELEQLATEILSQCASKSFAQALMLIERGLQRYPGTERLLHLQQSVLKAQRSDQEQREIALGIERCEDLCRKQNPEQAVPILEALAAKYPDNVKVAALNQQVIEQTESRKKRQTGEVQEGMRDAQELLAANNAPGATQLLEKLAMQYSDHHVLALLERSRALEREQKKTYAADQPAPLTRNSAAAAETRIFSQVDTVASSSRDSVRRSAYPPQPTKGEQAKPAASALTKFRLAAAGGLIALLAVAWGVYFFAHRSPQRPSTISEQVSHAAPTTPLSTPPSSGGPASTPPVNPSPAPEQPNRERTDSPKRELQTKSIPPSRQLNPLPGARAAGPDSRAQTSPASLKNRPAPSSVAAPVTAQNRPAPPSLANVPSSTPPRSTAVPDKPAPAQEEPAPSNPAVTEARLAPAEYHGPPTLRYMWLGKLNSGQNLVIRGGGASTGTLKGDPLPRVAGSVRIDADGITVVQQPSLTNGFQLVLRNIRPDSVESLRFTWVEGKPASP